MQRPTCFDRSLDQQLRDLNPNDNGSSTGSVSPPFSAISTSPLDVIIGSGSSRAHQDPTYGHIVGVHGRQHSSSRASTSTENMYGASGHATPRSNHLDNRHFRAMHPYALAVAKHKAGTHNTLAEDRLDDLWSMHGVGGSAHLGAGITDQLAAATLGDSWNASPSNDVIPPEVLDTSSYFTTFMNPDLFTVDPSRQLPAYDVHNPFGLFGPVDPISNPIDADMDVAGSNPETQDDSPASEEQEVTTTHGPTTDRSAAAASSCDQDPKTHDDTDEHDDRDATASEHENHDDHEDRAQKPTANNFVRKLHQMISDPKAADFIWWTELGTSFVVSSAGEFSRSILGQHFKHNNFSSFVRQLNMYGFHKINRTPRNQRVQPDAQQWEFSHKKFLRGREDLLDDIKRKPVEPDPSNARQRVELPSEVAAKLRQMSMDHAGVVEALQIERQKVVQLAGIVKVLYDRLLVMNMGPLPVPFPHELLDSRPPNLGNRHAIGNPAQAAMDISGDSLVPSRNINMDASGSHGHQPSAQQTAAIRSTKRSRSDPDNGQDSRQPVHKSNSTGSKALSSNPRNGAPTTWSLSTSQNLAGADAPRRLVQTRPPDSSQLIPQLQVKHEANVSVR